MLNRSDKIFITLFLLLSVVLFYIAPIYTDSLTRPTKPDIRTPLLQAKLQHALDTIADQQNTISYQENKISVLQSSLEGCISIKTKTICTLSGD